LSQPPVPAPDTLEKATVASVFSDKTPASLVQRLLELALPPIKELMATAGLARKDLMATRFLFSLPGNHGGRLALPESHLFIRPYFERLALSPSEEPLIYQEGQTGMFTALSEAKRLLQQGLCRFCLLIGVESYLTKASLQWLDNTWRLKSARNVDGFIPGECAVALLLEKQQQADTRRQPVLARVGAVRSALEKQTLGGERLSTGQGLTDAIRDALGSPARQAPFWTACDLNGESYRAHEWGLCLARLGELLAPQRALWHPSDCIGDVGAASGGLYVAMTCRAFARGYAPAERALLWASADEGTRSACVVERPD
jgi:3-oxoacyl-[acyl-carrier-protein] synthase-1